MNTTTAMYDLPYRNYDAALGRFHQMDPLDLRSADLTAYHYAGNNPVIANDPTGLAQEMPLNIQIMNGGDIPYSVPKFYSGGGGDYSNWFASTEASARAAYGVITLNRNTVD
jgi:RHS repeat-associated protein